MLMTVFVFLFTSIPASEHPEEQSSIYTNDTGSVLGDEVERQQWLYSNFPTADASASVSEHCVRDTRIQLAALRHQMPWALQSILTIYKFIINSLSIIYNIFQCTNRRVS